MEESYEKFFSRIHMANLSQQLKQSLTVRVKRRLFSDNDHFIKNNSENSNLLNLCDAVEQSARAEEHSHREARDTVNTENILIITTFQDSGEIKLLCEQATLYGNTNVLYCLPENAFPQSDKIVYNMIFTDIDLSTSNEMLRIIVSIRKMSSCNKTTPIIAVCQKHHSHANDLSYYGVSEVYRGELQVEFVQDIMLKYKSEKTGITPNEKRFDVCHDERVKDEHDSSVSRSPIKIENELINVTSVSMSPTFPISEENRSPVKFTTVVVPPTQARRLVRPIMQRPVLPKPHANIAQVYPTPPASVESIRRSSFISPAGLQGTPHCFPYMVSGVPGSSTMKIAVVEEDGTKHSTKERLRRERIKACCEQMRLLLPKTGARKIDMASVFELAVIYMKVVQTHSPVLLIDKCGEIFKATTQIGPEKRKQPHAFNDVFANPMPVKRRNSNGQAITCSPGIKSPQANTQVHCLGGMLSSPLHHSYRYSDRQESIYPNIQPVPRSSLSHIYPGMEYYNYSYESMTSYPTQLAHQISLAASTNTKESPMINDVPLNIPVEFAQHPSFYPHYS